MPRKKREDEDDPEFIRPYRPPTTREARQSQLENLALDLIEKRFINGEASPAETTLFAKSASTRGRMEEMRIQHEIELMKSKKAQIDSAEEMQRMFKDAIDAMKTYRMDEEEDPNAYREIDRGY